MYNPNPREGILVLRPINKDYCVPIISHFYRAMGGCVAHPLLIAPACSGANFHGGLLPETRLVYVEAMQPISASNPQWLPLSLMLQVPVWGLFIYGRLCQPPSTCPV